MEPLVFIWVTMASEHGPSKKPLISAKGDSDLPGLENLDKCEVVVLFTRRLKLEGDQLARIDFVQSTLTNAAPYDYDSYASRRTVQSTMSYVTGAHTMKIGYQGNRLDQLDQTIANQTQLAYRFNLGAPNAVSYYLPDFGRRTITSLHGFFVQAPQLLLSASQPKLYHKRVRDLAVLAGDMQPDLSLTAPRDVLHQAHAVHA